MSDRIEPYLPRAQVVQRDDRRLRPRLRSSAVDRAPARVPGQLRRLRPLYAYVLSLGADGLAEVSDTAVLNANYLWPAELCGEHLPVAFDRTCMHEFVLTAGR